MKVILTIGAPQSGHLAVFDRITQAGVVCAAPCRDASLSPQNLQEQLLRSMEVNLSSDTPLIQLTPGRLWNELASDLFLTNIDHPVWGWADHQSVCLMDFWREFDPQVRLLLVYNSPLAYLQQVLIDSHTLTADAIAAALATWSSWNTALLRYFHRHPQHCLLINSQQTVAEPAALIELLKTKWQIAGLTVQESTGQGSNQTDLLTHLISQMLDPQHPAWALHQELESVAQLTVPATAASNDPGVGIAAAWAEWAKARTQAETASQEQSNLIAAHADLTRARDQLGAQLAAEAKAKAEAIAQRDAQASAKAQAIAQRDAEAKSKAEAIAQRDAEAKAKAELQAQVAQAGQASAKASTEATELKQENELLLLQLHQVQEELEVYFLKNQTLAPLAEQAEQLKKELASAQARLDAEAKTNAQIATQRDNLAKEKTDLAAARDEQGKLATERQNALAAHQAQLKDLQSQHEQLAQKKSKLIAAHADMTRARDQLSAQLATEAKAKAEALTECDAQASAKAQAIAQRDAEAKSKAEAIAQRDAEAKAKAELQAQVAQAAQASAKASTEVTELKQENELLLLQLHQVQEELEHYFLRYQEIERQQQSKATGFVADFWRMHQPQELVIDMQQDVTGNNWYPAESDGRWAGPAALSTLQMPPLQAGNYTLELDIVDAMSLAIVNNLVVEALGQTPPVEVFYPLYQGEYPLICKVPLTLSQAAAQQPWSINLRFHQLVCPADTGADANDRRNLSMRLRSVKLVKQS